MLVSLSYFFPIISENVLSFCWKSFPRDAKLHSTSPQIRKKNFLNFFLDPPGILSQLLLKKCSVSLAELLSTCPEEQFEKSFLIKNFCIVLRNFSEKFPKLLQNFFGGTLQAAFGNLLVENQTLKNFFSKNFIYLFLELERTFMLFERKI